jgi:hypothetical protein
MTRALLIVTLLAMLGVLPGLAGAAQSDAVSNAVSANGPAGYSERSALCRQLIYGESGRLK